MIRSLRRALTFLFGYPPADEPPGHYALVAWDKDHPVKNPSR